MRVLVTGASGFAGRWLCRACRDAGDEVLGVSRSGEAPTGCAAIALDIRDGDAIARVVRRATPEVVYHLAALSNVGDSWREPATAVEVNVGGAVTMLAALRSGAPDARVVWVSSSEVYGTVRALPIAEDVAPAPESPYAVSKLAGEQLAAVDARAHGLSVVIARPFSHSGPGQQSHYLLSNLAWRGARARAAGAATLEVSTGNPEVRRDFTDVRDVVRAYRALAASGAPGVFNVCAGTTRSTAELVGELARLIAPVEVRHVVDPGMVRASEVMELRGSANRLLEMTGWRPEIPLRTTLADTLAFWERERAGG